MKPQFNSPRQFKLSRDNSRPLAFRPNLLATDHSYHPASGDLLTTNPLNSVPSRVAPSFRDLSKQFLGAESARSYAIEASLFAIIVAISAWPLFAMAHAMAQLK